VNTVYSPSQSRWRIQLGWRYGFKAQRSPNIAEYAVNDRKVTLAGDELLPAIDVVGRARDGRVDHDVDGERRDVGGSDDTPGGECGAELIPAGLALIAPGRCRQRSVDEAGGDDVHPDGRELEREAGREGGECGRDRRHEPEADAWAAGAGAAHEQQRASRSHLVCGVAGDLEDQHEVPVEVAAR